MSSWFFVDKCCKVDQYPIVVTQGKERDYRFYCSNPDCVFHEPEDCYDDEPPFWCEDQHVVQTVDYEIAIYSPPVEIYSLAAVSNPHEAMKVHRANLKKMVYPLPDSLGYLVFVESELTKVGKKTVKFRLRNTPYILNGIDKKPVV